MSQFQKDQFDFDGMYLMYRVTPDDAAKNFVARFKHRGGDRAGFQSFLIKNFSVEEYFAELHAGQPPLKILESRGYVSPSIKRLLKQLGYPQTAAGKRQYLQDATQKYAKK